MFSIEKNNNSIVIKTSQQNLSGDTVTIPAADIFTSKEKAQALADKHEALYTRYKKEVEFLQSVIDAYDVEQPIN